MHCHLEVILAPDTKDIKAAVALVMKPFDENMEENEEYSRAHAFWDWFVLGGRFAGEKEIARLDKAKLEAFNQWCVDEKVTVSGLQSGKQELSPASQIAKVDAKWNEMFPTAGGAVACPLFKHSNDQYGKNNDGMIDGDISRLGDSKHVKCSRVIFSGPSFDYESNEWTGEPEAKFMLTDTEWNGVNHMDIRWDGTIGDALSVWLKTLERRADDYRKQMTPTDDCLCVTVDYHS